MPVLTCPFTAIPAQQIANNRVQYPQKVVLSTELAIKPTASETWGIEGISLGFTTNYPAVSFVNVAKAVKALNKSLIFANESQKFLKAKLKRNEEKKPNLEGAQKAAEEATNTAKSIWVKAGSPLESESLLSYKNAEAASEAARATTQENIAETESIQHEIEAGKQNVEGIEREKAELGRQQAREAAHDPPLIIIARVYARGNELVYEQNLPAIRFQSEAEYRTEAETTVFLVSVWNEIFTQHTQFDDPIEITERENLRLTLEFIAPPNPKEIEGGLEGTTLNGNLALSQVEAVVNYSRTVAS